MSFKIKETQLKNGGTIRAGVFGNGPRNVLILPGMSLVPVTEYTGAVEDRFGMYADRYTFWLIDRKRPVEEGYSIKAMSADTAEAVKAWGIEKADVYGASQGGMIALYMALDFPELVNSIVVASAGTKVCEGGREILESWTSVADRGSAEEVAHAMFNCIYSDKLLEGMAEALDAQAKQFDDKECPRIKILAKACLDSDMTSEICRIGCPVFAVGGELDPIFDQEAFGALIREMPGCESYIYPKAAQAVYDEAPDFVDRAIKFLDRQ